MLRTKFAADRAWWLLCSLSIFLLCSVPVPDCLAACATDTNALDYFHMKSNTGPLWDILHSWKTTLVMIRFSQQQETCFNRTTKNRGSVTNYRQKVLRYRSCFNKAVSDRVKESLSSRKLSHFHRTTSFLSSSQRAPCAPWHSVILVVVLNLVHMTRASFDGRGVLLWFSFPALLLRKHYSSCLGGNFNRWSTWVDFVFRVKGDLRIICGIGLFLGILRERNKYMLMLFTCNPLRLDANGYVFYSKAVMFDSGVTILIV